MSDPYSWWVDNTSAATVDPIFLDWMPATANGEDMWSRPRYCDLPPPLTPKKKTQSKWLKKLIKRRGKM
jgi:hypothetical protein